MPRLPHIACCSILLFAGCHLATGLDEVDEVDTSASGTGGGNTSTGGTGGTGATGGMGPICGDGEVNQPSEACDGGPTDTINCDEDCTLPECGDGHINQLAGEGCDDGNTNNGDGCSNQCVLESCGNATLDAGEECDDGNRNNNDDCLDNCVLASCGDGILHDQQSGSEQCDDGNNTDNDDCLNNCAAASCGDGVIHDQQSGNEICDDGNTGNNDGCSSSCTREAGACCAGEPSQCVTGPINIGGAMLAAAIPDNGFPNNRACQTFNFTQMGCGNITDVNVTVGIDHSYVGDMVVRLESPNMVQQVLLNSVSDSSNLSAAFPITFDDEAPTDADDMGEGISSTTTVCQSPSSPCEYSPNPGNLSSYDGASPMGAWEVCVSDVDDPDAGTLQSIDIEIATQ